MRGRVAMGALVCLLAGSSCAGQGVMPREGSCGQPPELYSGKFKIRAVRVQHPFAFLRFIAERLDGIPSDELPAIGSVLDLEKVNRGREAIEARQFLPSPVSMPVRLDVIIASLANCRDGQLDVVYQIYSTQVLPAFSSTFESRTAERTEPQQSAGLDTHAAFRLVPEFHFDNSNRFQGGGQLQWRLPRPRAATVSAEGRGSSTSRYIAAAISGVGAPHSGPISRIEWQLDYLNSEDPAGKESLRTGRLAARFSASTRPLGKSPTVLRFGASLEGGNQQSNFDGAEVASNTVASSSYGSLKIYAGLTANTRRHAFAASYGLDLGTLGASMAIEYRRHVVDLAYSLFLPIGDHRGLDLESRFTAGAIQTPGKVPLPQRFFGGNSERNFIVGDSWQIRANPVVRSFSANRLNQGSSGVGAEQFFSYNLTGAIPVWRRPLVPRDLTDERDFTDALDLELSNVPNLLAADRISKDTSFRKAVDRLPALWDGLLALENALSAATVPDGLAAMHKACRRRLAAAKIALEGFRTKQSAELFSLVNSMVDPGREMARAEKGCLDDLNGALRDAEVAAKGRDLHERIGAFKESFDAIDMAKYEAKAESGIKPVRRVVDTILYDLNLYSISPVFVFDVARIGEHKPGTAGGLRYAVGAGIRLTLVNSLNFTLGYAFNPDRRPFEERGALFFGLSFRDLFQ